IESLPTADRRVQRIRLTAEGRARFAAMAAAHERWIDAVFADLSDAEADELTRLLERAKRSLHLTSQQEPNG
ncbi:MAG TPA: hypothetical protein VGB60_10965, partial [Brevundimonas sp.]